MNAAEASTNSLLELYQEHIQQVTELQHLVQQQYPPHHPSHHIATNYLNDRITLFRFLKKANYALPEAYNLVDANVAWRIAAECDHISPRDMEDNPLWINGLVQLRGQDRYGHPVITIRLRKYVPAPQQEYSDTGEAEENDRFLEYKRYIIFVLECTRKLLWESSRRQPPEDHSLQASLILDLQGASVSDLDHQMISYTIDLLKHRYPSCFAQVYVLNYSWVFGGIWQMLKRALPETARARVSFPSSVNELHDHFDLQELSTDFGGTDAYEYDPETCEIFHYFGYPMLSLQSGTPTSSLSRVNSCDSIYFDAISTPLHSPGLRPHDGLNFLSMTPMMPMAPPSSGNNSHLNNNNMLVRPNLLRTRSNSIPLIDLNNTTSAGNNNPHQRHHTSGGNHSHHSHKSTPLKASLLKHSKSSANIPSFMITPSIESDLPTQYPLSRKDRTWIGRDSGSDPKNPRGGRFYRLILRPNSIFMKIAARQQGMRNKVVKVVKTCADKMMRTDMKTLLYWVMALIMLRGEVWQLIAATAVKVLTVVGDGDELLL
ncbi:CRAL-TRIO domain-containing protein [Gamsiella multidivaricata]|uniref:CRAL-TRIO domain-containing protein n=1 Tax=Gamsiella multidivaricata TaxID=101098 RepID=UPI00221F82CB|nr:CRAL-TRIO domain-containing protein [Gamsiella multidivaricata]KAG0361722.1 hypothetical protein BGZ54_008991 [Gamsiella multidivaricata]KAI7818979.1 CRAL-TRIO domain-containing protein [Gamsiella multidivaricata]